jgi:formylglycine-generating enzyme required for sulfatase activity
VRAGSGGNSELKGLEEPNLPVTCVTADDARAYAKWAGKVLPTEDEWLRAALGDKKQPLPWGEVPPDKAVRDQYAIFDRGMPEKGGRPAPTGGREKGASPFGAEDLAGNVDELLAGEYRGKPQLVVSSYTDEWEDWEGEDNTRSIEGRIRITGRSATITEAAPWRGFRCVLVIGK